MTRATKKYNLALLETARNTLAFQYIASLQSGPGPKKLINF